MSIEMTEKEMMVERWSKLAGLVFDVNHDDDLLAIFQEGDAEEMQQALTDYSLVPDDADRFVAEMGNVLLSGWWVGHELPDKYGA